MGKYKVLKEFVLNGVTKKVDEVINLSQREEQLKSIKENIEKVPEDTKATSQDGSALGSVKPGTPLTEEQKKKLAEENARISVEANKQASEQLAQDIVEGRGEPVVKGVAEALKDKLVNEEFQHKQPDESKPAQPGGDGQPQ